MGVSLAIPKRSPLVTNENFFGKLVMQPSSGRLRRLCIPRAWKASGCGCVIAYPLISQRVKNSISRVTVGVEIIESMVRHTGTSD